MEGAGKPQLLVQDRHQEVDAHGDPYLGLHRIGRRTIVVLDAEVAFQPLEEKLYLPAHLIDTGNRNRGDVQVVREKDNPSPVLGIVIVHSAELVPILLLGDFAPQFANLVAVDACRSVDGQRLMTREPEVVLGPCNEERA